MNTTKQGFQKGNKIGNRFNKDNQPEIRGRKQSNYSLILKEGCSKQDLIEIFKTHVQLAKEGNVNSFKIIAEYFLGKTEVLNVVENDSATLIQQNITNVFNSPQTVSNESLLNMLNNTIETIEITENNES